MHAVYGYTCIHCGHGGAGEADHLTPLAQWPDQPLDPYALRPSHGSNYPCPVCPGKGSRGRCCNQERATKSLESMFTPKVAW